MSNYSYNNTIYEDVNGILQSIQVSTRILNSVYKSISNNYSEETDERTEKNLENIDKVKDLLHNSQNKCIEIHQMLLISKTVANTENNSEFDDKIVHTPPPNSPPPPRFSRPPFLQPQKVSPSPFTMFQRSLSSIKKSMSFRSNSRVFIEINEEI